jgi:hypothetical protein
MFTTVGDFKKALELKDDSLEVSFGSSKKSKRPLIFYRLKIRGDNILGFELTELSDEDEQPESFSRKTVKYYKEILANYPDETNIVFSNTRELEERYVFKISEIIMFDLTK